VGFFGWIKRFLILVLLAALGYGGWWYYQSEREKEILEGIIARLTSERRVAEVWVEQISRQESGDRERIKLKILEFDVDGKPLQPIYCTFSLSDVIHFEALVIRLSDELVKGGEGKSIHLFRRAYALDDGGNTYEACELARPNEVPGGYRLAATDPRSTEVERRYWQSFWNYALDEKLRTEAGVRNAQIEAPATRFQADQIYRLFLEADGGLTIQASPVPEILKGERVPIDSPAKPEPTP
jgi:hypothetical protein